MGFTSRFDRLQVCDDGIKWSSSPKGRKKPREFLLGGNLRHKYRYSLFNLKYL
uniref:Uncharacterized protein n=1 Tax=Lepeophtheirus salmonis TaxID=72036 RepID=A0A0K2T1L3_LEPSM